MFSSLTSRVWLLGFMLSRFTVTQTRVWNRKIGLVLFYHEINLVSAHFISLSYAKHDIHHGRKRKIKRIRARIRVGQYLFTLIHYFVSHFHWIIKKTFELLTTLFWSWEAMHYPLNSRSTTCSIYISNENIHALHKTLAASKIELFFFWLPIMYCNQVA